MKKIALCIMLTSMYELSASRTTDDRNSDKQALIEVYGRETGLEVQDQYDQWDVIADRNLAKAMAKVLALSQEEVSASEISTVPSVPSVAAPAPASASYIPREYNEDEALRQAIAESLIRK